MTYFKKEIKDHETTSDKQGHAVRFTIINTRQGQMSYWVIKDNADLAKLKCNQDKTNLTFVKDYILF